MPTNKPARQELLDLIYEIEHMSTPDDSLTLIGIDLIVSTCHYILTKITIMTPANLELMHYLVTVEREAAHYLDGVDIVAVPDQPQEGAKP